MDEPLPHSEQMPGELTRSDSYIAFNGLDYMMLHNLFYIAFRKEDLKALKINNSDISLRSSSQRAGTIEAGCSILGSNVTYSAVKQIKLVPGFSATSTGGKTFVATVGSRPNNYDGSAYVLPQSNNSSAPYMVRKSYLNTDDQSKSVLTDDQSIMENISICPNPCRGKLAISVDNSDLPIGYYITNLNGVVVHKDQITSNHQIIDISVLPKGVYFISLCLKDKTETKKIILI